jgi:hypothetical protein
MISLPDKNFETAKSTKDEAEEKLCNNITHPVYSLLGIENTIPKQREEVILSFN